MLGSLPNFSFFFFNDTATTEIYTLSLHDALPICPKSRRNRQPRFRCRRFHEQVRHRRRRARYHAIDRKSTRLNSSHLVISYAVFCLKKKKKTLYILTIILLLIYPDTF